MRVTLDASVVDPSLTVAQLLEEQARVRREQMRARNIRGLAKFRETHHEKILENQRAYREANRDELARKNREYRARKKLQAEKEKLQENFLLEKNLEVS